MSGRAWLLGDQQHSNDLSRIGYWVWGRLDPIELDETRAVADHMGLTQADHGEFDDADQYFDHNYDLWA